MFGCLCDEAAALSGTNYMVPLGSLGNQLYPSTLPIDPDVSDQENVKNYDACAHRR